MIALSSVWRQPSRTVLLVNVFILMKDSVVVAVIFLFEYL